MANGNEKSKSTNTSFGTECLTCGCVEKCYGKKKQQDSPTRKSVQLAIARIICQLVGLMYWRSSDICIYIDLITWCDKNDWWHILLLYYAIHRTRWTSAWRTVQLWKLCEVCFSFFLSSVFLSFIFLFTRFHVKCVKEKRIEAGSLHT